MYIEDINDLMIKTNIRGFIHTSDFIKGKSYDPSKITFIKDKELKGNYNVIKCFHYEVDSESKQTYYDVSIFIENNKKIVKTMCDCKDYRHESSCKHIAAVFINYYNDLFNQEIINIPSVSNDILDKFLVKEENIIKKEINLQLVMELKEVESYYYYEPQKKVNIKLLIGLDKLYTLNNHVNTFKDAYESGEGEVSFGKSFTYDPAKYYFSDSNNQILNAYFNLIEGYGNKYFSDKELKKFLGKIKNYSFIINDYQINKINEGFPVNTTLTKNKEDYMLDFDLDNIECLINEDYEYILYKGKMYHLNNKEQDLLKELKDHELNKLLISKNKVDTFSKGLLGIIRKNLTIDSDINDIILPSNIATKIYFDLRNNYILADPRFTYDEEEVAYFDTSSNVLRDMEFETKVINDLIKYGFVLNDNKIILDNLELEVDFLENGLENLATKYEIFTTERFKKISIRKKTNITSMFGIGQDNILSYNFNLGNINSSELVDIFKDVKSKKKYYRLKNGDILSLEDEAIKELYNLKDELELSDEEIINGHGSILKYRAIYLDSLKNTKYSIIKTDNLFDNFIKKFYEYKDSNLTLPKESLSILRDYQLIGVKWLYNLAKTGFGGILADEMGLGKTIQVIFYIKQMLNDDPNQKFLIVVPTALAYNWDHEFSLYVPKIKRAILVGSKEKRKKELKKINNLNVLITTYGLLREDQELYENLNFNTMIIDEAQNIKNSMAGITKVVKKIKAETKFALTGTPLENSILELWSIFDFIMPGYLANLTKFQTKYKIKDFDEESEILISGLSKEINPFILRRKKKDVIKELPDKMENNIYIDLKEEQKKLYVAELEKVKEEMNNIIDNEGLSKAKFLILQLLTKLRQICIDPSIVYENYEGGSNKLDELDSIVSEYVKNGHKILIFSSFKTALNIVKERFKEKKISTYMIDGSVPSKNRIEMVDEFNKSDQIKVFLIMLKSGGTGLNLASADIVIHLDLWWNPQAENQATDRAHRIGQKNTVEVIHLITKGTIEEKILELQNKKKLLSDKVIDGEIRNKNVLADLTKDDIINLLSFENKD